MTIKLNNTAPGDFTQPLRPEGPFRFSVSDKGWYVDPQHDLNAFLGTSALLHNPTTLPDADPSLSLGGASVVVETPGRVRPVNVNPPKVMSGGRLVITKTTNSVYDSGVYEVTAPVDPVDLGQPTPGCLFRIRFEVVPTSWVRFNSTASAVVCPFFQLEMGGLNTALTVLLRDDGVLGSVVVQSPAASGEYAFPWLTYQDGQTVDLFVFYSFVSRAYRVFIGRPGELVDLSFNPIGPSDQTFRPNGPSNVVRAIFGNAGRTGDVLAINDWALLPQAFQALTTSPATSVVEPAPGMAVVRSPDTPVTFAAADRTLPEQSKPYAWLPQGTLNTRFIYRPGSARRPIAFRLSRTAQGQGFYSRILPSFDHNQTSRKLTYGALLEAKVRASASVQDQDSLAAGLELNDGTQTFRLSLLNPLAGRSAGLLKDSAHPGLAASYASCPADYSKPIGLRLVVDRLRSQIELYANTTAVPQVVESFADMPIATDAAVRASFGHFDNTATICDLDVERVLLVAPYFAWEGTRDGNDPASPGQPAKSRFNQGRSISGFTGFDFQEGPTARYKVAAGFNQAYIGLRDPSFREKSGIFVEFGMNVSSVEGYGGEHSPLGDPGPALQLVLDRDGTNQTTLTLGFFDAGIFGKKICLRTTSATDDDFLNQTDLGRQLSADCDWTNVHAVRLLYRAFDNIEVYVDNFDVPVIVLPWDPVEGFDFPVSATGSVAPGLSFGVFGINRRTTSYWDYVRWGWSTGVSYSATPFYGTKREYLFGGKSFLLVDGDEQSIAAPGNLISGDFEPFSFNSGDTLDLLLDSHPLSIPFTGTAAQMTATGISFPISGTLDVRVDNRRVFLVSIVAAASYTDFAAQMQPQISGATVVGDNGGGTLTLTSLTLGVASQLGVPQGSIKDAVNLQDGGGHDFSNGTGTLPNLTDASSSEVSHAVAVFLAGAGFGGFSNPVAGRVIIGASMVDTLSCTGGAANSQLKFPGPGAAASGYIEEDGSGVLLLEDGTSQFILE